VKDNRVFPAKTITGHATAAREELTKAADHVKAARAHYLNAISSLIKSGDHGQVIAVAGEAASSLPGDDEFTGKLRSCVKKALAAVSR